MIIASIDYHYFRSIQPIIEVPDADFVCVRDTHAGTIGLGALAGLLALLLSVIMVIYNYRGDIKVMLYFKLGWRPFDRRDDSDILDKVGRICYSIMYRIYQVPLISVFVFNLLSICYFNAGIWCLRVVPPPRQWMGPPGTTPSLGGCRASVSSVFAWTRFRCGSNSSR